MKMTMNQNKFKILIKIYYSIIIIMYIIDYVLYNGEPIMQFRLEYLNQYVDRFIIVESIYTHSGNRKTILLLY